MKRLFLLMMVGIPLGLAQAQDVVVNEIHRSSNPNQDWIELLVLTDDLDMRGMKVQCFGKAGDQSLDYTFANVTAWSSVAQGTTIVLLGQDFSEEDTDFSDDVVQVKVNNGSFFSGNVNVAMDENGGGVQIRTSGEVHIHGFFYDESGFSEGAVGATAAATSPSANIEMGILDPNNSVHFFDVGATGTFVTADFDDDTHVEETAGTSTRGVGNDAAQVAYIDGLREEGSAFDCTTVSEIPQGECEALVTIYNSTNGANWRNATNWLETTEPCLWAWLTCTEGHITKIRLGSNRLAGEMPRIWNHFPNLTELDLTSNQLTGVIPSELGDLSNLTELSLHGNQLTGAIPPELGNLSNLTELRITNNQLTGEIPAALGNLSNLTELSLHGNQLMGAIPPELGNLSNLTALHLHSNELTGEIPAALSNLSNLTLLWLYGNQLTGGIPTELGGLGALEYLYLHNNALTGSIPPELGQLSNLVFLNVFGNQLTGTIPPELGQLSNLRVFQLQSNQLTGTIPTALSQLASLQRLDVSNNQLTGEIPVELGNLSNLRFLYLDENQFSGEVPVELGNLAQLENLYVSVNPLAGALPHELMSLSNLTQLYFNGTELCAPVDDAFQNWLSGISVKDSGIACPVGTDIEEDTVPHEVALSPNYPNPFNPETQIAFALPKSGDVRLAVYDLLGREVVVLVEGHQAAGRHVVRFSAQDLPSGMYLYRLHAHGTTLIQKMTLLK